MSFLSQWRYDPPHRQIVRILKVARRSGIIERLREELTREVWRELRRQPLRPDAVYQIHTLLHPQRLALCDPHRSLTYAETAAEINRLRQAILEELRLNPGDRVLLLLENRCEYFTILFALYGLGMAAVHGSFRATAAEIAYLVRHSQARAIFTSPRAFPEVERYHSEFAEKIPVISLGGAPVLPGGISYEDLCSRGDAGFRRLSSDPGKNFVYTSGTTGRPKGAYRNLNAIKAMDLFRILETVPFRAAERHLVVCPMYHSGAQAVAFMQIAIGASLFLLPDFEPGGVLKTLAGEKIESSFMVPTMIRRLLSLPEELRQKYFPQDLRVLLSGAAPFPHPLRVDALEWLGLERLYDFYGATELGWVTTISGKEMLERPGSVGRPIGGCVIKILDENKKELPSGKIGIVYVRSPTAIAGYWNDPEAEERFRHGPYFTVEDLGTLDEDGYLYLKGRARDMIISGGVNIYPAEIENLLEQHPSVKEVAIVGLSDPDWGERVVAVVVPRGEGADPEELSRYLRRTLASYKVPKEWHFWDELPRNPTGKVLKREIVERLSPKPTLS